MIGRWFVFAVIGIAVFTYVNQSSDSRAASGAEQPSMDLPLMLRGVETVLRIVAETVAFS